MRMMLVFLVMGVIVLGGACSPPQTSSIGSEEDTKREINPAASVQVSPSSADTPTVKSEVAVERRAKKPDPNPELTPEEEAEKKRLQGPFKSLGPDERVPIRSS